MPDNQDKKIIIVTSGQPSLNPRMVKEADALADAGYEVIVFYAYWNDWGTKFDEQLLRSKKWKAIRVGGDPAQRRFTYLVSRVIQKAATSLANTFDLSNFSATRAISRSSHHLVRAVRKHKADLYIAHNPGALPATVIAAKKHGKPCGFDAEDFHRHEVSDDPADKDVLLKKYIEDKFLPQVNYLTVSSPLIADAYRKLFPKLDPVVLLNVFPDTHINKVNPVGKPLKLFWFSQTIGPDRGIEDIMEALKLLDNADFELHLLGYRPGYNHRFFDYITQSGINIKFHEPVHPDDLANFTAQFDIGLTTETGSTINRNICLTNKLFTYIQSGLAVVATDTDAQKEFMEEYPAIGSVYPKGDAKVLANVLKGWLQNPDELMECKKASLRLAKEKLNWETESQKFLKLVENTLSEN